MFFKQLLHSSIVRFALIALVLCGITLVGTQSTGHAKASQVQSVIIQQQTEPYSALATTEAYVCNGNTTETLSAPDQIIIACQQAVPGNIDFFTTLTNDARHANRVLATALTAQVSGKQLVLTYDPDANNTPAICDRARCHKLLWLSIK